jgi:broad specificity phosphatase PhoE
MINNKFGEMRLGEFEGLALRGPDHTDADAIRQRMQDFGNLMYQHKRIPWPAGGSSGESIAHVEQRGRAGLDQIWRAVPRGDPVVCVVAHGRFNTILLMALLGLQGRSDAIPQDYTGISVLDVDPEGHWKARVLNYVEHANHVKARNE